MESERLEEKRLTLKLILILRELMNLLNILFPTIYKQVKMMKVIKDQTLLMKTNHHAFDIIRSTLAYVNPVIIGSLRDEILFKNVIKRAKLLSAQPNKLSEKTMLILQEDDIPRLIVLPEKNCCIEDLLVRAGIECINRHFEILPFDYFSLNYIVLICSNNYRVFVPERKYMRLQYPPDIFVHVTGFIQTVVDILRNTGIVVSSARITKNGACSHNCNFIEEITNPGISQTVELGNDDAKAETPNIAYPEKSYNNIEITTIKFTYDEYMLRNQWSERKRTNTK